VVISEAAYLILLAVIAGERGFELILSRRNARRAFDRGGIEVGQSHYSAIVIFHVLFLVSCAIESLIRQRPFAGAIATLALSGTIAAQSLRYWAVRALGERWNTRVIVVPGQAPVTSGPFRYLRHPNYLAVVMELACLPMIRGLWITALGFSVGNAVLLSIRIPIEEHALGASYAQTFAARPRFVPKIG
jgi:methyltransferase